MANPNRAMANLPQRAPVEEISCKTLWEAQTIAEEKRKAGFDAKATMRQIGPRRAPIRIFTCFVYNKIVKG